MDFQEMVTWIEEKIGSNTSLYGSDEKSSITLDHTDWSLVVAHGDDAELIGALRKHRYKRTAESIVNYDLDGEPVTDDLKETLRQLDMFLRHEDCDTLHGGSVVLNGSMLIAMRQESAVSAQFRVPGIAALAKNKGHWAHIPSELMQAFVMFANFGIENRGLKPELRAGVPDGETFYIEMRLVGPQGFTLSLRGPKDDLFRPWFNDTGAMDEILTPTFDAAVVASGSLRRAIARCGTQRTRQIEAWGEGVGVIPPKLMVRLITSPDGIRVMPGWSAGVATKTGYDSTVYPVVCHSIDSKGSYTLVEESILKRLCDLGGELTIGLSRADYKGCATVMQVTTIPEVTFTLLGGWD